METHTNGFAHADPAAHQRILEAWAHINAACAEALGARDNKPRKIFCPTHEADGREAGHNPSCDVRVDAKGRVTATCWSLKCDSKEIIKALRKHGAIPTPKVVVKYIYEDEQGAELFAHARWDPKNFTFERNGSFKKGCMDGARYALYGLRDLRKTLPGSCWIGVPEGERDTETLWGLGLRAVCDARGAGNIKADVMGPLKDHRVAVFTDADEPGVKHGRLVAKLALEAGAAEVRIVGNLDGHKDISDAVAAGMTRERVDALIEAAAAVKLEDLSDVEVSDDTLYTPTPGGLVLGKDGAPISNFVAYIVRETDRNDGSGVVVKEYLVELTLNGVTYRRSVPQEGFDTLNWVSKHFPAGASYGAGAGCRDHVRNAIRTLSLAKGIETKEQRTHTGWVDLDDGANVYLTGRGGIGATREVEVALPAKLSRYSLPLHVSPEDQVDGVRASLRILEADVQRHHGYGLLALVYRSVLGNCNLSGHLTGDTGALKSTRLELMMRHFGAGFTAGPGGGFFSWSGTANSIEVETFATKDCLTPIDEFCPPSTSTLEKLKQDDAASRLFRAQADGSGRSRLNTNIELRAERAPRGLIVSTGESIPGSHAKGDPASLRARILVIKIRKSDARKEVMAQCTLDGARGKYANAMSGYIAWLAPRLEQVRATIAEQLIMLRAKVAGVLPPDCHERTASMIADLHLSFSVFLKYALEIGALTQSEHDVHVEDVWQSLLLLAAEQAQQGHSPTERFLQLVRTAISTERAYLEPLEAAATGWGYTSAGAALGCKLIGWFKEDDLFLEPDVAYKVVSEISPLPVDIETLKARLKEEGKLASYDAGRNRNTVRRLITKGKPRVAVLHLKSKTLAGE